MLYKFLDSKEKIVQAEFKSFVEAEQYAQENGLLCLAMEYNTFVKAFTDKIERFKNHSKYKWLAEQGASAVTRNCGFGVDAVRANDFMKRIIALPTAYITDWLDGKNQLEWLSEYELR